MTAGILGVPLGSYLSTRLSKKYPRSDPVICAVGLLISAPLIAGAMLVVTANSTLAYILVFLGEVALNCNWAIVADMLLVRFLSISVSLLFHFYVSTFPCLTFLCLKPISVCLTLIFICKNMQIAIKLPLIVNFYDPCPFIYHLININASKELKWSW